MGPTHVKINHRNLIHNFNLLKKKIGPAVKCMAVVKANAYGHGLTEVARSLENEKVDYLGVAFPGEGAQLRNAGIKTPVLVMCAHLEDAIAVQVNNNLDITITRVDQLTFLNSYCSKYNKKAKIHFKINTGMNRIGLNETEFFKAFTLAKKLHQITIAGIYTHLSSSDEDDQTYTRGQIKLFTDIRKKISNTTSSILFHTSNSAGIMQSADYHLDMVRAGVTLYGNPSNPDFTIDPGFKEVMSFHTRVMLIRETSENQPVSYSRRYYTKKKTKIAVLPVGYADGYNRALTNKGIVLIGGQRYPVAGTVCMNHTLVDIGNADVQIGDEVVLFGRQGKEHISITDIARQLNTIPYEVTCWISSLVERVHLY